MEKFYDEDEEIAIGTNSYTTVSDIEQIYVPILAEVIPNTHYGNISNWNDSPNRKELDVVMVLRKAAELARNEGI